jgi:transposase InsO family protein
MGRVDRSGGQDATMERRHIQAMLRHIDEYECVKRKQHGLYKTAASFYKARGLCKQNFLKYYRRYVTQGRVVSALIPHRTGRKYRDAVQYAPEVIEAVQAIRSKGYNRFDISRLIKQQHQIELPPTSVYRLMKKLGIHRLNSVIKEEKRRIVKMAAGELGHVDIHYIAKGTVKECGQKKLYLLGIIDSYSRVCWLEVLESIAAVDVMFAGMEALMRLKDRYDISFTEMLSDNGSEFSSRNNPSHPFERMLRFYGIKHRYTKPFTPQTNGKIERFWKTIEDELLAGEQFETLDELKHHITGYAIYYNEHRAHQGIDLKTPAAML